MRWLSMQDWHPIFSGNATSARELASELEARGLRSFVDDREGPIVTGSGGREEYSVILVPPEESGRAGEIAQQWESRNRQDAHGLASRLTRIFAASFVGPAAWVLGHLLFSQVLPAPSLGWLAGVWLVSLVLVAQVENRRRNREHITMPAA